MSDRASAKLMISFYQNLQSGQTLSNALRKSQLFMFNNPRFIPLLLGCV
ncbi:CHAT domain-containing protein [Paraglaciecola hydrolytica]